MRADDVNKPPWRAFFAVSLMRQTSAICVGYFPLMRILFAHEECVTATQIYKALKSEGFTVEESFDGIRTVQKLQHGEFDVIILDVAMPRLDVLRLLPEMRQNGLHTPVLLLMGGPSWQDRVTALDAGADDCLPKPFQIPELTARVRAMVRRANGHLSSQFTIGDVVFDTRANRVLRSDNPVNLTVHELAVVTYLFHNSGRLIPREELAQHIYGEVSDRGSNTIAVFVNRLRKMLGDGVIETVRGRGYVIKGSA